MSLKAIIFDFDGTLVDSNFCKRNAFFELFPDKSSVRRVIKHVLSEMGTQSRYAIFPELLNRLRPVLPETVTGQSEEYIERYRKRVLAGQMTALEMHGAGAALRALSEIYPLYLSTITPQDDIEYLLKKRSWFYFFKKIFGYPNDKVKTILNVMDLEEAEPTEVVMVGDGSGDQAAAEKAGCKFEFVGENFSFEQFVRRLLKEYG